MIARSGIENKPFKQQNTVIYSVLYCVFKTSLQMLTIAITPLFALVITFWCSILSHYSIYGNAWTWDQFLI